MTIGDQLIAIAQIAVALAGFAGVVATFHLRGPESITRPSFVRLRIMIELSLCVCIFSLLPMAIYNFGASDASVWNIANALLSLFSLFYLAIVVSRWSRGLYGKGKLSKKVVYPSCTVALFLSLMLVLSSFGAIKFHKPFSVYVFVLFFDLILACLMFARLVILPLLKSFEGYDT